MISIVNKLGWILILLAFAIVGALLGWLMGASNSPVVASAIPLVAGLVGGFSFRYLERRAAEDSYAEKLKTATDDSETRKKIAQSLGLVCSEGNECWAYSCYGRKVETAIGMRKNGSKLILIHETDFRDSISDCE